MLTLSTYLSLVPNLGAPKIEDGEIHIGSSKDGAKEGSPDRLRALFECGIALKSARTVDRGTTPELHHDLHPTTTTHHLQTTSSRHLQVAISETGT